MNCRVMVFAGQKGGTGKTTASISVAGELMHRGNKVLLVDADPQRSASTSIGVGCLNGYTVPPVTAMGAHMHIAGQLDVLTQDYDYVVIDCPSRQDAKAGAVTRSALLFAGAFSGLAILPCGQSAMEIWALDDILEVVEEARVIQPGLMARVLITRRSTGRTSLGGNIRPLLNANKLPLFDTEICHRLAYQESPAGGLGVAQYRPKSQAANEIRALSTEIEGVFNAEKSDAESSSNP